MKESGQDTSGSAQKRGSRLSEAVWEDLRSLIKDVVEEMNRSEELRNRTGGLEYQITNAREIIVNNRSNPLVSLTIRLLRSSIEISGKSAIQGPNVLPTELHQRLKVGKDEAGKPLLMNDEGDSWPVDQFVYQILRPFLHVGVITD